MKSEKLYHALKALLTECVDNMGLPQKPTIKVLYKARDIVWKYEKEQKKHELEEAPIPTPLASKDSTERKLTMNYE
ncbi:MAG: hypothetical protein EHM34_02380 [Nitrosopumilales archaeon]|nr:MAG: hypothetical protein EHM34_02380 [Nitrosopumilales archaeon]